MKKTGESRLIKRKVAIVFLVIIVILVWIIGEMVVSYHWIKVEKYSVTVKNLPGMDLITDSGFRMVVISDLHDHEFGSNNERLVQDIKKQKPQMIILGLCSLARRSTWSMSMVSVSGFRPYWTTLYILPL